MLSQEDIQPLAREVADEIRGYDLGDDLMQLHLMEDLLHGGGAVVSGDWLYYGVLLLRARRFQESAQALACSIARGEDVARAAFLRGCSLLALGSPKAALESMERAVGAARDPATRARAELGRDIARTALEA